MNMSNLIGSEDIARVETNVEADRIGALALEVADLAEKISEVKALAQGLYKRYSWEEKTSESGIQIAAGPTTVLRFGTLLSVCSVPTPQGLAFAFVLQDEASNKFAILSPDMIKPAPR